jgi:hypothetical protein
LGVIHHGCYHSRNVAVELLTYFNSTFCFALERQLQCFKLPSVPLRPATELGHIGAKKYGQRFKNCFQYFKEHFDASKNISSIPDIET